MAAYIRQFEENLLNDDGDDRKKKDGKITLKWKSALFSCPNEPKEHNWTCHHFRSVGLLKAVKDLLASDLSRLQIEIESNERC